MIEWNKEQIENFLRHETMKNDTVCHTLAATLAKDNLLNKIIRANPEEYSERVE